MKEQNIKKMMTLLLVGSDGLSPDALLSARVVGEG